jgi:hypothetical protein
VVTVGVIDDGDPRIQTLTVSPWDESTVVALEVTSPLGVVTHPVPVRIDVTAEGAGVWSALVIYTLPGVWRLSWTVTGTGAGVEHQRVSIAPTPLVGPPPES